MYAYPLLFSWETYLSVYNPNEYIISLWKVTRRAFYFPHLYSLFYGWLSFIRRKRVNIYVIPSHYIHTPATVRNEHCYIVKRTYVRTYTHPQIDMGAHTILFSIFIYSYLVEYLFQSINPDCEEMGFWWWVCGCGCVDVYVDLWRFNDIIENHIWSHLSWANFWLRTIFISWNRWIFFFFFSFTIDLTTQDLSGRNSFREIFDFDLVFFSRGIASWSIEVNSINALNILIEVRSRARLKMTSRYVRGVLATIIPSRHSKRAKIDLNLLGS